MAFLSPLLLGALAAVGLPVLLHLLMRQKPKHLLFPAFRFLQQRAKTNQRKIRLRHLILLLLRMLLIALIVLALARPRIFSDRGTTFLPNQSVAVVLVVDTSRSMEYTVSGKTRLDEARQRALELLDDLSDSSRIAIVDTGDQTRQWMSVAEARERLRGLTLHAGSSPVTSALPSAYGLFVELEKDQTGPENEALPRFVYVFSDRTVAAWDPSRLGDLQAQRDRLPPPGVTQLFIDVGVEKPIDVAIVSVDLKPQSVPANREVVLKATVAATGQPCDTEIVCRLSGETTAERQPVKLEAGQSAVIEFRRKGLKPGQYQAELALATADALPSDNSRFVTFEVRGVRRTLLLTDEEEYAFLWESALLAFGEFDCDVKSPAKIESADDLKPYLAVVLLSVRAPGQPVQGESLWAKLERFVKAGGSLLVVPGRDELSKVDYTSEEATKSLLPGLVEKVVVAPGEKGAEWDPSKVGRQALLAKFAEWDRQGVGFMRRPRQAYRYWAVKPLSPRNVVVPYAGKDGHPAILERIADREKGCGRVVMFTTPLDYRPGSDEKRWNDYDTTVDPAFLVALANETVKYLVGDLADANFNYVSGQALALPLSPAARFPEYTLEGPGIVGGDSRLLRGEGDAELRVRQTDAAGNFIVTGGGDPPWKARYSLNPPPAEFVLERVPVEEVEKLFGLQSVVPIEHNRKMTDIVTSRTRQPIELFPWLMLLFVLALALESYFANRFYKEEPLPGA